MQLDKLEGIALRVKWFLPSHPQLAEFRPDSYLWYVIIVKFRDEATQKRAIGFLIGRFPGHSWATGEMAVPEEALAPMARESIPFTVGGPATHERILSLRDSLAAGV